MIKHTSPRATFVSLLWILLCSNEIIHGYFFQSNKRKGWSLKSRGGSTFLQEASTLRGQEEANSVSSLNNDKEEIAACETTTSNLLGVHEAPSFTPSLESLLHVFQRLVPSSLLSPRLFSIVTWNDEEDGNVVNGGLLVLLAKDQSVFFPRRWRRSRGLPLLHVLGLMSDAMIIMCGDTTITTPEGLIDGLVHRVRILPLEPGNLMVWMLKNNTTEQGLALQSMNLDGLSPSMVNRIDLVADETLMKRTLEDWNRDMEGQDCSIVDCDVLMPLIQQAYRKLGGQETNLFGNGILLKDVVAMNAVRIPRGGTSEERIDANDIARALDDLQDLQLTNGLDETSMPIHFGKHAKAVVDQLNRLEDTKLRAELQERLEQLHREHTQTLRDYFGRLYETMLENSKGTPNAISGLQAKSIRSFRRAAQESIPPNTPEDFDLSYVNALAGLSQDMQDITDLCRDLAGETLAEGDHDDAPRYRWNPPKWLKSLAARAIMLGVNYAQGWLALQGIRQAALERELNMPKIPLY